jgi:CTP synthase
MTCIESIRQFRKDIGNGNSVSVHLTLVPHLNCSGEIKTKPTTHSVRELSEMGITPDIVVCRTSSDVTLSQDLREKIAMFCNLDSTKHVIHNRDCRSIYEVPVALKEQGFDDLVLDKLGLKAKKDDLKEWKKMVDDMLAEKKQVRNVVIIGKYANAPDTYYSIVEAVKHAGLKCGVGVSIKFAEPNEKLDNDSIKIFADKAPYSGTTPRPPQFKSRPYAPHSHFVELIGGKK